MAGSVTAPAGISRTLRISGRPARVVMLVLVAVHAYLALTNLSRVDDPVFTIAALALFLLAGILITREAADPFPRLATVAVVATAVVAKSLAEVVVGLEWRTTQASWYVGAATIVFVFLAMRGRAWAAWIGFALGVGFSAIRLVVDGMSLLELVGMYAAQMGTLLVGTLFGIGVRRTDAEIRRLHRAEAEYAALAAREVGITEARREQTEFLERVASPALERIAEGGPFDEAEKLHWLRLESAIRDSLRAPALLSPELVESLAAARERDVDVRLFDDSSGAHPPDAIDRVASTAVAAVDRAAAGDQVTIRVLPAGRDHVATIVQRADDVASLEEID